MRGELVQRVYFLLKVKKEKIYDYKRMHAQVWPEMLAALSKTEGCNYSLFLRDDGTIVGYLETPDFPQALARRRAEEVIARWRADMMPYFEDMESFTANDNIIQLEEIFPSRLDQKTSIRFFTVLIDKEVVI